MRRTTTAVKHDQYDGFINFGNEVDFAEAQKSYEEKIRMKVGNEVLENDTDAI